MLYTLTEIKEHFEPLGFKIEVHGGGIDFYRPKGDYVFISTPSFPATLEALKDIVDTQFVNADKYLAKTGAKS